jgi:hypothetical protein
MLGVSWPKMPSATSPATMKADGERAHRTLAPDEERAFGVTPPPGFWL